MPQDRESGARAVQFGKENAERIAATIGATLIEPKRSNLASHRGRRVVLKSAREGNNFIGIPYSLLDQVTAVVAALEDAPRHFTMLEISADVFRRFEKQQPRRAVGQVPRSVFHSHGTEIGDFSVDEKTA